MRRFLAAALLALVMAGYASADYLLIVINLNAKPPEQEDNKGGPMPPLPMGGGPMPPLPMGGGGMPPRPMGGGPQPKQPAPVVGDDADDVPDLLVAVVELTKSVSRKDAELFNNNRKFVKFSHKWGTIDLTHETALSAKGDVTCDATLLGKSGTPLLNVKERFAARKKDLLGGMEKKSTHEVVKKLALFALELGLVDDCAKVLDELALSDKDNASVKAYLAIKGELDKAPSKDADKVAAKWKEKLLSDYKISSQENGHFALIHPAILGKNDVDPYLAQLEKSFRAYYYWWACKGVALPMAKERQVAVLTEEQQGIVKKGQRDKTSSFSALQANLTASPEVTGSFFARREGMSVFSSQRDDLQYGKAREEVKFYESKEYKLHELLTGKAGFGIPKTNHPRTGRPIPSKDLEALGWAKVPRIYALVLKSMEHEWELNQLSHQASRQMLFATKQLPRNVQVPEWIQFGMGSLFESPLQSPWPTIGAPNPYWMPRFAEAYKTRKYEATSDALLKKVVTDAYFHDVKRGSREADLRKARAAAWALTYYVACAESGDSPKYLANLQRYFKELSKQPRDVRLDENTLWACFTRAFELNTPQKVKTFADGWISYAKNVDSLEAAGVHARLSDLYKKMTAPPPAKQGGDGGGLTPMPPTPKAP